MAFARPYPRNGVLSPLIPSSVVDRISLGGRVIPCWKSRITAGALALKVNQKKTLAQNGARPTYHGLDVKPLTIEVQFKSVEQKNDFAEMIHGIGPATSGDSPVVPIEADQLQHLPALSLVKIRSVSAILGDWPNERCVLECDHWLSPPSSGKKQVVKTDKGPENKVEAAAAAKANPKPTSQPSFCGPPNFTPAS